MRLGLEAGPHTLDIAVEQGITGVPISAEQLVKDGAQATLAPLSARGLAVCQIGAFGYNPLSTDQAQQAHQKAILEQAIPLAAEVGCPYIVICGGNYHPSGFGAADARNFGAEALDSVARELSPIVALAEKHGVKISIEPYLKTAIGSPERFLTLWQKVGSDALRVNIDVTSFYDFWDMWDSADTVRRVCSGLAEHYGLGHIKDVGLADGFHIHIGLAPLGSTATDWAEVLRLMELHLPPDSWLILEHVLSADEARASLACLRSAAASAGVTLS